MKLVKTIRINQFGTSENLVVEQAELHTPPENEVLINLYAAGVNPSDVYTSTGTYAIKPNLPYTPGLDGLWDCEKDRRARDKRKSRGPSIYRELAEW